MFHLNAGLQSCCRQALQHAGAQRSNTTWQDELRRVGIKRTFNTDWDNEILELTEILSSSGFQEEEMHALKQLTFLQDKFAAYVQHVCDHTARLALPLCGCCFEVSFKSRQTGRIHTHDYVGPS